MCGAWPRVLRGNKSDFVFTTGMGRPLDGTLVTRDLKRILGRTWVGGRPECAHQRRKDQGCLDCSATRLPVMSYHALRHSCASLLLAAGMPNPRRLRTPRPQRRAADALDLAHVLDENRAKMAGVMDRSS